MGSLTKYLPMVIVVLAVLFITKLLKVQSYFIG